MPIDGTLFCLGYFEVKYLLRLYLQLKMITSYSLLKMPDPANYANFSSVNYLIPGLASTFWHLYCVKKQKNIINVK